MNENQIDNHCRCGERYWDGERWRELGGTNYAFQHCPHCGYDLGDDGVARRTVVVEEVLPTIDEMRGILSARRLLRRPPMRTPPSVWLVIAILLISAALFCHYMAPTLAEPAELSADPCQRVAEKALAGAFGELTDWQSKGYQLLAEGGAVKKLAWITHYWVGEPGVNHTTASGRKVSSEVCAMLDVPFGSFLLVDLPAGFNLRRVWDRGSRANRGRARSRGAQIWCDLFVPRSAPHSVRNASHVRPVYILKAEVP